MQIPGTQPPAIQYRPGTKRRFLFRNLKKLDDDLKAAVSAWLDSQPSDFYLAGIGSLPEKWSKCAELRGIILKSNDQFMNVTDSILT